AAKNNNNKSSSKDNDNPIDELKAHHYTRQNARQRSSRKSDIRELYFAPIPIREAAKLQIVIIKNDEK
ncbi:5382_t:CDS:2, partial [Entrophospora sp. SA101]